MTRFFTTPGCRDLLWWPAFPLVIPALVGINIRTFPFSSFPRRRESSEEGYGHVVGIRSFLLCTAR